MEVPDFCKKAAPRQLRKRKTELDADPDFTPDAEKAPTNDERKKVRRSKKLEEGRKKPPAELQFIERPGYSVEDCKKKSEEVRKLRSLRRTTKAVASALRDSSAPATGDLEGMAEALDHYASADPHQRYRDVVDHNTDEEADEGLDFDFYDLPNFVMGTGKGTEGGPPANDFKSLWNYKLDPLVPELDGLPEEMKVPWKRDVCEPDIAPQVLSVVGSFSVGCHLDLKTVATESRNVEFNPDKYAPLIMRIREPKCTGLIFRTGRIIVNGARSEEDCRKAARKFARVIQKCGYNKVRVLGFHIQNILAACTLTFKVRLNQLCQNKVYGRLCYEPEIFPGLLISMEFPKVKVILFCSGSMLMTGAKSVEDLNVALKKVYPLLRMYAP